MRNFIEIMGEDKHRRYINVKHIEEVVEIDENSCYIYMAFNCPDAYEQDYFTANMSYDEVLSVLNSEEY